MTTNVGETLMSDDEIDRNVLLRDVARVFRRATPAQRCWLADRIAGGRERIHARARKDAVDVAIDIMEKRET